MYVIKDGSREWNNKLIKESDVIFRISSDVYCVVLALCPFASSLVHCQWRHWKNPKKYS